MPPPGFCQAAPVFDWTVRSVQPHCPAGPNSWFACTETQYVPPPRLIGELSAITKLDPFVKLSFSRDASNPPGRLPLSA
jgi:hypothetical protein